MDYAWGLQGPVIFFPSTPMKLLLILFVDADGDEMKLEKTKKIDSSVL